MKRMTRSIQRGSFEKEFEKIEQMVSCNLCEKPKERARGIESAIDWMHNNVIAFEDESLPSFEKFGMGGLVPITRRSQPERRRDFDDIPSCVRHINDDADDPTGDFKKIDQMLSMKRCC